ncbi:MAG: DUF3536 domain-containing protein [Methanomicrobiales archaeon]|nr:DUF3536 domain-containing protein [Methanomicrobiales archaeon]
MVGRERSAAPWHDWNERITDECYLPNTAARILDGQGFIRVISNNYSRISCDFGPTLLTWLERAQPGVYEDILRADTLARERFSGHGSALAHPFHHLIIPLLSRADKETEVRWGIRDFEDRFGRFPEGMWIPEMAVDMETLGVLAEEGISFTLLSPHQGCRIGQFSQESTTHDGSIDTTIPYLCRLPAGAEITIFFQDTALSSQVAFGDLLQNGDQFSDHLLSASPRGGLVHFATDGETYGHHRPFGEMALSWCLDRIETSAPGTLTVYGEYLAEHPPEQEIEIVERTSWSCPHGIGRWHDGCSCESGRHAGWSHGWRGPLRTAIQELSSSLTEIFSREAGAFFHDPWFARDESIGLLSDRSPESIGKFFRDHTTRAIDPGEQEKALALLEMARQGLAMQTSCAWFFDDIADPEVVQVLRSAARAIQIARDWTGTLLEQAFTGRLSAIQGNRPQYPDGGVVYRDCVLPLILSQVHQAACLALIDSAREGACVLHANAYSGEFLCSGELITSHDLSLLGRKIRYCFMSTGPDAAVLGFTSAAGIPPEEISGELLMTLRKKGYTAAAEKLTTLFPCVVSLAEFPLAGQQMVVRSHLDRITRAFNEAAGVLFDRYAGLEGAGLDPHFVTPWVTHLARYVLTFRMEEVLSSPESTEGDVHRLAEAFSDWGIADNLQALRPSSGCLITRLMEDWICYPGDRGRLGTVVDTLTLIRTVGAAYPAWNLQNLFIAVRDNPARVWEMGTRAGEEEAVAWWEKFRALGHMLGVSVPGGAGHPLH